MIRIGVTGHRALSNYDDLIHSIDLAFDKIISSVDASSIQILSSLAEGADRLVASLAIENHGAQLIAPLPFKTPDYMLDFDSEASQKEFHALLEKAEETIIISREKTRQECYLSAGRYILKNCDVLIAVWNGKPAKGVGGTADIVSEARMINLPIAWIQTSANNQIIYENFPIKPSA